MKRTLIVLPILFVCAAFAQDVIADWNIKDLTQKPSQLEADKNATIKVEHINDVLPYTYTVVVENTPVDHNDAANLAGVVTSVAKKAGESPADPCADLIPRAQKASDELRDAYTQFLTSPVTTDGGKSCTTDKPCSLSLEATRPIWEKIVDPKLDLAKSAIASLTPIGCDAIRKGLQGQVDQMKSTRTYLMSNDPKDHVATVTREMKADNSIHILISELYKSTPTGAKIDVTIAPANNRLTLSAGFLFSEIQNRGYTSQAAPSSTGTGTQNVLAVSGLSQFSPYAVGLLNYQIPSIGKVKFDGDHIGLAISSGPVIRINSQADASSFGYFAGVSVHLYHRLFITPGWHIGQFADYPVGFSAPLQPVPSGMASLNSVNRWTTRFAISFTYRAKDFSSVGIKSSVSDASQGNKPDAKPVANPPKKDNAKP